MTLVARTATTVPTLFQSTSTASVSPKETKDNDSTTSSQESFQKIYSGEIGGESDEGSGDESYISLHYDQGSDDILNQLKKSTDESGKSASTPPAGDTLAIEAVKRCVPVPAFQSKYPVPVTIIVYLRYFS